MKIYFTKQGAVADLHQKGYTHDFQLLGNDLFWVQQKKIIPAGDFSVLECHRFCGNSTGETEMIIIGVLAIYHNVKGILINHYTTYTKDTPPVIARKIKEMFLYTWSTAS